MSQDGLQKSIPILYNDNERLTHRVSAQHSMLAASILRNGGSADLGCSPWVIYRALVTSSWHPRSETALGVSKAVSSTPDQTDVAQFGELTKNLITLLDGQSLSGRIVYWPLTMTQPRQLTGIGGRPSGALPGQVLP